LEADSPQRAGAGAQVAMWPCYPDCPLPARAEIEHVTLLAITTAGWPAALAAFSWAAEELGGQPQQKAHAP
jgi:hypothetical protein